MRGLIVYQGKYGATQQYAQWLGEALNLAVCQPSQLSQEQIAQVDFLLLGTSVYIGKFQLREWLQQYSTAISTKKLFLFIVAGTPAKEQEKWVVLIQNNVPEEIRSKCRVYPLPGKLVYQKLSWLDKIFLRVGAMFIKEPRAKERMLTDYNAVKKENLEPLLQAVQQLISPLSVNQGNTNSE